MNAINVYFYLLYWFYNQLVLISLTTCSKLKRKFVYLITIRNWLSRFSLFYLLVIKMLLLVLPYTVFLLKERYKNGRIKRPSWLSKV